MNGARIVMNIGEISEYTHSLQFKRVATNPGFSNSSEFLFRAIGQVGISLPGDAI